MEFFACLIVFLYERLLFLVGHYHERQPFFPPDRGTSSSGVMRLIVPTECETCQNLRQWSFQANLTAVWLPWVTAYWQFSAGRSIIFPKHAHLQQPWERGSIETKALRRCWLSHICTVKKPWNQDRDPVFSYWSGSLFTVHFFSFSSSSFSSSFIFFWIKAFK